MVLAKATSKALFESIEEDQIRRGVLTLKGAS
jgi:4-hydroxyphenylpyruvate dioxygenase-like putative hemolysin